MKDLVEAAREARSNAHCIRSDYAVGAAIRTRTGVFTGFNVEHSSYTNDLHAEEVAISRMIEGDCDTITEIAISSSEQDGITPCGNCRQFLKDFVDDELLIYCDEGDSIAEYTLDYLLPEYGKNE